MSDPVSFGEPQYMAFDASRLPAPLPSQDEACPECDAAMEDAVEYFDALPPAIPGKAYYLPEDCWKDLGYTTEEAVELQSSVNRMHERLAAAKHYSIPQTLELRVADVKPALLRLLTGGLPRTLDTQADVDYRDTRAMRTDFYRPLFRPAGFEPAPWQVAMLEAVLGTPSQIRRKAAMSR